MVEHHLIERMLQLINVEFKSPKSKINIDFLNQMIDFLKNYADYNHHGKEENILFLAMSKKNLTEEHKKIMLELLADHKRGREYVSHLESAKNDYLKKDNAADALKEIFINVKALQDLYPKHIEKEDKHFFLPSLCYFNDAEKKDLLDKCLEFDKKFDHQKYVRLVEEFEKLML